MAASGRFFGIKRSFERMNLVTQGQAAFFQTPQHQLIRGRGEAELVNGGIEVGVFHAPFDQLPLG